MHRHAPQKSWRKKPGALDSPEAITFLELEMSFIHSASKYFMESFMCQALTRREPTTLSLPPTKEHFMKTINSEGRRFLKETA